uniref:GLOBIN domain-containing protein n=1 Tax=Rhabditophanes sp. KR3021 TaxID=114890 RepID=A0AC35TWX4_9BILA
MSGRSKNSSDLDQVRENKEHFPTVRAHWIQLFKINLQSAIISETFMGIVKALPHMKPYWSFVQKARPYSSIDLEDDEDTDISTDPEQADSLKSADKNCNEACCVYNDYKFNNHVATVQAAITILMDNIDDYKGLIKLLREFGSYHFFYEAFEPHFEIFHRQFMRCLIDAVISTGDDLEENVEKAWNAFFDEVKENMSYGVALQRHYYLKNAFTMDDLMNVEEDWISIKKFGEDELGIMIYGKMKERYDVLIKNHALKARTQEDSCQFKIVSLQLVKAIKLAITNYSQDYGFTELPELVKDFTKDYMVINACPTLLRKAYSSALIYGLRKIVGNDKMVESKVHVWGKLYRILEQVRECRIFGCNDRDA